MMQMELLKKYNMKGLIKLNKLQEFVGIINSKLGAGYVYGGQNEDSLTKETLASLVKSYGKNHYYFKNYSAEKWIGKEYYDCSGLIIYTLSKMRIIPVAADYTAQNIYSMLCVPISKNKLKAGDLCFQKSSKGINHVGVYMGNGIVVHSRGTSYGVVKTSLFESFKVFGRLKYFLEGYPEVSMIFGNSMKRVLKDIDVLERPNDNSNRIGKLAARTVVAIEGILDMEWYLIALGNKKGYVKCLDFEEYDELAKALEFLSEKAGIDKEIWYNQAKRIKWLDICFVKIARSFGGI